MHKPLPFPPDLEALLPSLWAATATAEEVGAFYLLARASWSEEPAGTLPADDSTLARLARVPADRWPPLRARLSPILRPGAHPDQLLIEPVARLHARTLEEAQRRRDRTRQASAGRWSTAAGERPPDLPACQPDPLRIRDGSATDPPRSPLRSPSPSPVLRSSALRALEISSGARAPEGATERNRDSIIAMLGDRAQEKAAADLAEWERSLVTRMLQEAIGRWSRAGLTGCPTDKAAEIAAGKYSSGERVQHVIETIDGMIAAADPESAPNPIGVLIAQLGLNRRGRVRVVEPSMFTSRAWSTKREAQRKLLLAGVAVLEAAARRTLPRTQENQA